MFTNITHGLFLSDFVGLQVNICLCMWKIAWYVRIAEAEAEYCVLEYHRANLKLKWRSPRETDTIPRPPFATLYVREPHKLGLASLNMCSTQGFPFRRSSV